MVLMGDVLFFGLLVAGLGISITIGAIGLVIVAVKILTRLVPYEEVSSTLIGMRSHEAEAPEEIPVAVITAALSAYFSLSESEKQSRGV